MADQRPARRKEVVRSVLLVGILCLALLLGLNDVKGAEIHREEFSAGAAGWLSAGSWTFKATNAALQGTFSEEGMPNPGGIYARWFATVDASGGVFSGNYLDTGCRIIGFSFRAVHTPPDSLTLRWYGQSNAVYFTSFGGQAASMTTGRWYHIMVSLRGKTEGGWVGSSSNVFDMALSNVTTVEVQVGRSGEMGQSYQLGYFFIDQEPVQELYPVPNSTNLALTLHALQPEHSYGVQVSSNLLVGTSWQSALAVAPTGRATTVTSPVSDHFAPVFYRASFPGLSVSIE